MSITTKNASTQSENVRFSHDRLLLPMDFGKIVGDRSKCSRCPYGNLTLSPFFVGLHKNSSNKVSRQEGFYVSDFVGKALAMSGQGHKQHGNMRDRTMIPGGGQADGRPGSGPFSPDWRLGRFDHSSDLARPRRRRSEKKYSLKLTSKPYILVFQILSS
jgi:hypothetical protein